MRIRALIILAVCLLSARLIANASEPRPRPLLAPFSTFPMTIGEWAGRQEAPFDRATLQILGADDYMTREYVSAGAGVGIGLYVGYWSSQRQGDTIHSPLNCLPGAGWAPLSKRSLDVEVGGPGSSASTVEVNRYVVEKGLDRELVLYWYQSHGRVVANEYISRAYLVSDAIRLHRTDAAIVRIIVPMQNEDVAQRAGVRFMQGLMPVLNRYLPS